MGDRSTQIRISLYIEHHPDVYKVRPELGVYMCCVVEVCRLHPPVAVIGLTEGTQIEIIQAVWNYVKLQNLIDKTDRRRIVLDTPLKQLLYAYTNGTQPPPESIMFNALPEVTRQFLLRPDPVKLQYTLDPSVPPPEKPQAWDIQLKVDDQALKAKMAGVTINASPQTTAELSKLDEEVCAAYIAQYVDARC